MFFTQIVIAIGLWGNLAIPGWISLTIGFLAGAWIAGTTDSTARGWASVRLATISFLVSAATLLTLSALTKEVHDFSVDGQAYHQQAILELENGWNPVSSEPLVGRESLWINTYAKGSWLLSTAIVTATTTKNIETGKVVSLLLGVAALFLALHTALTLLPNRRSWGTCIATAIAANPVLGYQWPTYYLDSQIGSLLLAIVSVTALAIRHSVTASRALTIVGASVGLLVNVKFTGLIFAGITSVAGISWIAATHNWKLALRTSLAASIGIAIGVVVIGWNPYVTNILRYGNPFFPLAGPNKVDIISKQEPKEFLDKDRLSKLAISLFARSNSVTARDQDKDPIELKIPFSVSSKELKYFATRQDIRIGGFGPLFGGCLLLSLLTAATLALSARNSGRPVGDALAFPIILMTSVIIIPEPWWARYVPQFWFIPFILALPGLVQTKSKIASNLAKLAIIALSVNCAIVWSATAAGALSSEWSLRKQLQYLSSLPPNEHPITANFSEDSGKHRLIAAGVPFREVDAQPCSNPMPIIRSMATVCVQGLELHDTDFQLPLLR